MDSVLTLHPAAPGQILSVPPKMSENLGRNNSMLQRSIDGPALNSGQRLDNINRTYHLEIYWQAGTTKNTTQYLNPFNVV